MQSDCSFDVHRVDPRSTKASGRQTRRMARACSETQMAQRAELNCLLIPTGVQVDPEAGIIEAIQ